jgi:hypothetical protein
MVGNQVSLSAGMADSGRSEVVAPEEAERFTPAGQQSFVIRRFVR